MRKLACYISSTHMNCKRDWVACIDGAKKAGFDGLELFSNENGVNFADMPEARCMEIADHAKHVGIKLSAHPWVNWEALPEDELIVRFRALLERCIHMEMREINMHLHFLASRSQGMRRVFAATDPCLELLARSEATLLYENVPEHGHRELGSEVMDFDQLFKRYGPDTNVMMNIDSGHAHIMHQIAPLAEDYGDRWRYTHINDNDGLGDIHVEPGAGTLDFNAFAKAAKKANYTGVLMMEYHETGLAAGMPILRQAYGMAGYELPTINTNANLNLKCEI